MRADDVRGHFWDAVLFDLDGTLADSVGLILRCYRHTMEAHGHAPDEAVWIGSLGKPLRVQFGAFAGTEAEAAAMVETYVGFQRTVHDEMVRPFPGTGSVLDRLADLGVATAIVTGKRREMTLRTLRVCGFEGRFQTIVTPDDVLRPKPDAEHVRAALTALGDPDPARVLMVGDAPVDIAAGRAAGVRTAAALWGPFPRAVLDAAGPDYYLADLASLLDLVP